jgi:hypothetical protein
MNGSVDVTSVGSTHAEDELVKRVLLDNLRSTKNVICKQGCLGATGNAACHLTARPMGADDPVRNGEPASSE